MRRVGHRVNDGELLEERKMVWQTIEQFSMLARPFLDYTLDGLFCDLSHGMANSPCERVKLAQKYPQALQRCKPDFPYGRLMLELKNGNCGEIADLTFTHDFFRDGIGGAPLSALRVVEASIPQLWADELKLHEWRRDPWHNHCQLHALSWKLGLVPNLPAFVLVALWAVPDNMNTLGGPESCMSAVALQFDYTCQTPPLLPVGDVPDWLKPGMLERAIDKLDHVLGHKKTETTPRAGTIFLGMTLPVNDEDGEQTFFFQEALPEGLKWKRF